MPSSNKMRYMELSHPSMQEPINQNNTSILKLALLIAEFAQQMSHAHEKFSTEVQSIVDTFKQKTKDLRKSRPSHTDYSIIEAWESLLEEIEITSQVNMDIMSMLVKNVCNPLEEVATYKGSQAEKLHSFREHFESMVAMTENKLHLLHKEYTANHSLFTSTHPESIERDNSKVFLYNAHNNYVLQLRASNRLIEEFHVVLPEILEELEEIYIDTSNTVNSSMRSYTLLLLRKNKEQQRRLEAVMKCCRGVNPQCDIASFVRSVKNERSHHDLPKYAFTPPTCGDTEDDLPNRLILSQSTEDLLHDHKVAIQKEAFKLASNIKRDKDITQSLTSLCQKNLASHLYEKVYETQEDLCRKRNEIRLASMQLATVKAQVDVLVPKQNGSSSDEKVTSASIKGLWKKAFKSMKANGDKGSLLKRSSSLLKRKDSKEGTPDDELIDAKDIDPVYSLLKCAADLPRSGRSCGGGPCQGHKTHAECAIASTSQSPSPTSSGSLSPKSRRKKLSSRMKSFSLDTPDTPKHLTIDETTKKKKVPTATLR